MKILGFSIDEYGQLVCPNFIAKLFAKIKGFPHTSKNNELDLEYCVDGIIWGYTSGSDYYIDGYCFQLEGWLIRWSNKTKIP